MANEKHEQINRTANRELLRARGQYYDIVVHFDLTCLHILFPVIWCYILLLLLLHRLQRLLVAGWSVPNATFALTNFCKIHLALYSTSYYHSVILWLLLHVWTRHTNTRNKFAHLQNALAFGHIVPPKHHQQLNIFFYFIWNWKSIGYGNFEDHGIRSDREFIGL